MSNNIGNISNSRINTIEQKIEISSDIPEDLKEPLLLWLSLEKADLEWKQEQRQRLQKIERMEEKKAYQFRLMQIFYSILLTISIIVFSCILWFKFIQPILSTQTLGQSNNLLYLLAKLDFDGITLLLYYLVVVVFVAFIPSYLLARWKAKSKFDKFIKTKNIRRKN